MIEIRISENTAAEEMAVYEELMSGALYSTVFERLDALEAKVANLESIVGTDTGWIDLPLDSGVQAYNSNQTPKYRKIGKIVFLRGAVTNILERNTIIGTLPAGFRPATVSHPYIQNTSMRTGNFPMFSRIIVGTDGIIKLEAISDGAAFGNKWFPINCCFVIE